MKRVLIDTDGGTDDAMALLLALRSPELRVEAITTVCGNVEVEAATRNVLMTLEVLQGVPQKRSELLPPVAIGASSPLARPLRTAVEVHGSDGLGNVSSLRETDGSLRYPEPRLGAISAPADEVILDIVAGNPGELCIITLGPLTNLAHAAERDASSLRKAKELIIMGGAFETDGNVTSTAEFNIHVDPEAARAVLALGIPTTIVGLDVTNHVVMTRVQLAPFLNYTADGKPASPLARFIADATEAVMAFQAERDGTHGCKMHDPLAVAVACDPNLTQTVETRVTVETTAEGAAGQTIADLRPSIGSGRAKRRSHQPCNAKVCVAVHAEGFFRMFTERVLQG